MKSYIIFKYNSLFNFCVYLQQIKDELNNWNMQFNSNLVNIDGRVLPTEMIVQGTPDREIRYPAGANVDWTNNLRCAPYIVAHKY